MVESARRALLPETARKELKNKLVVGPFLCMDSKEFSKNPKIYEGLTEAGIHVDVRSLDVGDYWIPTLKEKDLLIERKTAFDLIRSVRDRRLWDQLRLLSNLEDVIPIVLLEGSPTLVKKFSRWSENSITQILWSISLDWNMKFMFTPSWRWTVISLSQRCKQENEKKKFRIYPLRTKIKREMSDDEAARYLVEGLPGVSAILADRMLREFHTALNVFTATEEQLTRVGLLGPKKARRIREILNHRYNPEEKKDEKNA